MVASIKRLFFLISLIIPCHAFSQKSVVFYQAKFKTGDQPEWKNLNFDESKWPTIKTTVRWEEQGYKRYDGYAWYRIRFTLPSAIKRNAYWKDTLSVLLSKIDDLDETFFNGVKIGQTGLLPTNPGGPKGKWDTYRIYNIPSNSAFLRWDQENVIAVRVYDISNGGGMFGPAPSVRMKEPQDAVQLKLNADSISLHTYRTSLTNTSLKIITGVWTVTVKEGAANKVIKTFSQNVKLNPFNTLKSSVLATLKERQEISSSFKETYTGTTQKVVKVTPYILTPSPSPMPHINSAAVFGVRPGSPFLFKIAATGKGVLRYQAAGLPNELKLDETTGIITGKISTKGEYKVWIKVSNTLGKSTQKFTIAAGDKLALTPPMGWNSWNCWGMSVSDEKVRKSAQAMVSKGLVNHGWNYINIDDNWQRPTRNNDGNIVPNDKFKDMLALSTWLHTKGLKFGIYSSPGPETCGGQLGSYQHERQDVATYVSWGVDYLKYDWCSYETLVDVNAPAAKYQKPYQLMNAELKLQPRDIVYSLCQYGQKDVWKWGDSVGGNCWRTTGDLKDNWESLKSIGFGLPDIYKYARPGNWNDPDMLMVGNVGGWAGTLRKTLLTPDEQYTQISLWSLLSSPLLIGCDLSTIDGFTMSLLTNDEVLAINQDIAGKQARQLIKTDTYQVWVKDLQDGNKVIGIFNMAENFRNIKVDLGKLGLNGNYQVRDLWRQKNIGVFKNIYNAAVPSHGVMLIKLTSK